MRRLNARVSGDARVGVTGSCQAGEISMRIAIAARPEVRQSPGSRNALLCRLRTFSVAVVAASAMIAAAQQAGTKAQPAPAKTVAVHKSAHPHRRPSAVPLPAPTPAPAPVTPVVPRPPDWPANDQPVEANVVWNSQGLRIEAANSSLSKILKEVATETGVKVEGLGSDLRIFGSYGPGPARDVLAQLLDGSGYNLLMIGDQGQGTPRQIVLSAKPSGAAPPVVNNQSAANDDNNNDADDQPPQPQQPPAIRNGFAPGAPPRTPQQIMQEMQQRQQQMQQNNPQ